MQISYQDLSMYDPSTGEYQTCTVAVASSETDLTSSSNSTSTDAQEVSATLNLVLQGLSSM